MERVSRCWPAIRSFELGAGGSLDWQVTRCPDATFNPDKSSAHQLVTLLFTSGTTGRPKGVMVTAAACATARNYSMFDEDRNCFDRE